MMAAITKRLNACGLKFESIICPTISLFIILHYILMQINHVAAWMPDLRPSVPDLQPKQDKIIARFYGNNTEYFKVLDQDADTILIGARDKIYNLSLSNLKENSRLEWFSSDADRELCALKGKSEADCHNYIRVFARLENGQLLLCGTNSYKPRCRNYDLSADEPNLYALSKYEIVRDVEAQGLCPYNPLHNSTYAFANGQLYSATVADFSGSDPLIYRENLRTEQYDLKQLNQPDFVGAIEYGGYVLFFFRELSMEYMNLGKTIYSRVGRVCKNDRGGPYTLAKSWTSFLKSRLNCSMPGEFPFYFDEIQAITTIKQNGNVTLVYAVFTTSVNAISGSAVCAFKIEDIMESFESRFKLQGDSQSHWQPIQEEQVPDPRPGQCVEDSRMLSSIAVNFVKNHPLMEAAVSSVYGRPLLKKVDLHHRLTAIVADSQILALNGEYYDVIYTGTDDGKVTKFFNIPTIQSTSNTTATNVDQLTTVIISEMQVLPMGVPIRELVVSTKSNTLLVVSDGSMVTIPLHHCTLIIDCMACLSLQDPNCAWDQQNHECKSLVGNSNKFGTKSFLQSLNSTKKAAAALCPKQVRNDAAVGSVTSVYIDFQTSKGGMPSNDDNMPSPKLHYAKVGEPNVKSSHSGVSVTKGVLDNVGNGVDIPTSVGGDYFTNNFNDENRVTLHSMDPDDPLQSTSDIDQQKLQVAGNNFFWTFSVMVLVFVFIVGMVVGLYTSKRICSVASLHPNHRNQFNSNSQFGIKHHNSGKDINLLMNPNHFCNQKKGNLDLEKDRSHECKNSTENLEKELPCKTSTLTKVKRTYI